MSATFPNGAASPSFVRMYKIFSVSFSFCLYFTVRSRRSTRYRLFESASLSFFALRVERVEQLFGRGAGQVRVEVDVLPVDLRLAASLAGAFLVP